MEMDWIVQKLIDLFKLPVEVSDDCGPARLRGLPLDLLGLAEQQGAGQGQGGQGGEGAS